MTLQQIISGRRPLEHALADLVAKMKAMPLNHPGRGPLATMIVGLEDEIYRRRNAVS
jgi:hypothetical protein